MTHVFAGHYHRNALARAGGIEMVTTGPIGKPLGEGAKSGMRIVTVSDDGIEHRYYDFGDLPNRVLLRRPFGRARLQPCQQGSSVGQGFSLADRYRP